MKKTIALRKKLIALCLFVTAFVFNGCSPEEETRKEQTTIQEKSNEEAVEQNFNTYKNDEFGIQLNYPNTYQVKEGLMGTVAAFLSPLKDSTDLFQENLTVLVQDLSSQPMTLKEFTELSLSQIPQVITDANIISSEAASLAGNPANKVVYTGKQGQYNLKWMQLWTIVDTSAYLLTYTTEIDEYDDYSKEALPMVDSFAIVK